jgi:tRNA-uridine 2-sulfurtransferase
VIEPFMDSYLAGETPIPCVACNQSVKFHDLLATARELGAAALATGHYAELRHTADGPELYRAADPERDQSYFLFATTREQLSFLRFPLGHLPKAEVRRLAEALDLPVASKPDSQDICFVPRGRYTDVIERLKPGAVEPGDIVHVDGRHLGRHAGIIHFTVGQRRGLGVASGEALYVVRVDADTRQVVVGPRDCLHTRQIVLRNVNWLGHGPIGETVVGEHPVQVRVRSTQPPQPATLSANGCATRVTLRDGEHGIAVGQACVLYADGSSRARVLGGGFIASAIPEYSHQTRTDQITAPI